MKTIMFYFSGSGNTYAAAKKLKDYLGDSHIMPMKRISEAELSRYDRVGILLPVYGTHAPKMVLNQLKGLIFTPEQSVFIVATYAGSKGYAVEEVREVIKESNNNSLQEFCVRMPGSCILEYSAFPQVLQNRLIDTSDRILEQIAECIKNGSETKQIKPNFLAVMFLKNGKKMSDSYPDRGKMFYTNDACKGCQTCLAVCPVGNISFENGRVMWGDRCAQCMGCVQWCPNQAVCHPDLKSGRKRYHHPQVNIIKETFNL